VQQVNEHKQQALPIAMKLDNLLRIRWFLLRKRIKE